MGGRVGYVAGLGSVNKREISSPAELNQAHCHPAHSQVVWWLSDSKSLICSTKDLTLQAGSTYMYKFMNSLSYRVYNIHCMFLQP
jgi:hypothetical protein